MTTPGRFGGCGRLAPFLAVLLLLGACQVKRPPPLTPVSNDFRAALAHRWETIRSIRAEARVTFTSGDDVFPARMGLVMKRPGKARADLLDPFGTLRGIVIIDGRRVLEHLPETAGETPAALLSGLSELGALGAGPPAEGLVGLLTGLPAHRAEMRWWGEEPEAAPGTTVVFLDPRDTEPLVRRVTQRGEGGEHLVVDYRDYREVSGVPLPGGVSVTASWGWALEISYRSLEIGVELDDGLFLLPGGDGAR